MVTPTTAAQQRLGAALRKLHRSYIRRLQLRLAERGVSVAQYLHLRALWEEGVTARFAQNRTLSGSGLERSLNVA